MAVFRSRCGGWGRIYLAAVLASLATVLMLPGGAAAAVPVVDPAAAPTAKMVKQAKAEREKRERERERTAKQRVQRAMASRSRHRRLGRIEARQLAVATFPEYVSAPLWAPPELRPGERIAGYRSDQVAILETSSGRTTLLDSAVPLRARTESGDLAPTDLTLEQDAGGFQPKNPVIETVIPGQAGEPISFPGTDLGVHLPVETDAAGMVVGDKVFYANTDVDTDWMVSATPRGVAVAAHLRSAESPHRFALTLDLPEGALLSADARGGVEVTRNDKLLATVTPPVVVDATGEQIPARYETAGNAIVISVDRVPDAEYPLLVDPVVDNANWQTTSAGTDGWQYGAANTGFAPGYGSPWGRGLVIGSGWGNYYDHTAWAWWNYRAPGGSHIYRADYNGLIQQVYDPARPVCYTVGVNQLNVGWAPASWNYGLGSWAPHISEGGPFVRCGGVVNLQVANCANIYCNDSTGTNAAGMQQWMYGGLHRYDWNRTYLAGAAVYLSDREDPSLVVSVTPGVLSPSQTALSFTARDPGLGIKRVKISSPTTSLAASGVNWNQYRDIQFSCYGTSWSPCPNDDRTETVLAGNLGSGYQQIRVEVWDAGNKYTSQTLTVQIPAGSETCNESAPFGAFPTSCAVEDPNPIEDALDPTEEVSLTVPATPPITTWAAGVTTASVREIRVRGGNGVTCAGLNPNCVTTVRNRRQAYAIGSVRDGTLISAIGRDRVREGFPWYYLGSLSGFQGRCGWINKALTASDELYTATASCSPQQPDLRNFASRWNCRTRRCDHGTAIYLERNTYSCLNVYPAPSGNTQDCGSANSWRSYARGACVEWRYVTKNNDFVMVKDRSRPNFQGSWLFLPRSAFAANFNDWPNIGTPGRERCP